MSLVMVGRVLEHSQSKNLDRLVLLTIADYFNKEEGCAWPSVKTIANEAGVSERTVHRALTNLVNLGELQIQRRFKDEHQTSNLYRITIPDRGVTSVSPPGASQAPPLCHTVTPPVPDRQTNVVIDPVNEPSTRNDIENLCGLLAHWVERNGYRKPKITDGWRADMRRLLDIDGPTEPEVVAVIDWCQRDDFWLKNIQSPAKLRKHFDRLRVDSRKKPRKQAPRMDEVPESWIRDPEVNW